eukprot:TRINITY_DN11675_c0_g1_i6.p1 TRINITY_DN11675_c0_g1~~TRINITY_DN11675_c0_g1_i6.p1  ORF type:complete len:234 (-),score=24.76 TRINITY_DN11675_c0_g1_i6:157-858(-)
MELANLCDCYLPTVFNQNKSHGLARLSCAFLCCLFKVHKMNFVLDKFLAGMQMPASCQVDNYDHVKELEKANKALMTFKLQDGYWYVPLRVGGTFYNFGRAMCASAFCIAVGASYMQRLLRKNKHLAYLILVTPTLEKEFGEWIAKEDLKLILKEAKVNTCMTIRDLFEYMFMCIFIASKLTDAMHEDLYLCIMRLLRNGNVEYKEVQRLELHCLNLLEWKLHFEFMPNQQLN